MKISAIPNPFDPSNLQMIKQIGVDDIVFYDMAGMPGELDQLQAIQSKVERFDLKLSAIEGGPPIDKIVLGKEGRGQQIENYKRSLQHMGKLGIHVLCYNFMPQVKADAMVIRTSYNVLERGGAKTSGFNLSDFDPNSIPHNEQPTNDEQMWDNLEYFLKQVIPAAEDSEILLAMHPDDPPMSPMSGLARIMSSVENFDRLLSLSSSPSNGITFCQGCFAEMGASIPDLARHFSNRINFVHFRDTAGPLDNFHETFPDNGPTDMIEVFRAYQEIGYTGLIRSDHVPLLATENVKADGYSMQGHIFAIGYMKGLMEPFWGK
jgi:mannonate dehydratase